MNDMELEDILVLFAEKDLIDYPKSAFKTIKNKYFNLDIPYSHLVVFASLEIETAVYALRKALSLPYFHTMGPNGKSVFIEVKDTKRLVIDFLFEYQKEERLDHYGRMLEAYLIMAETVHTCP